MRRRAQAFDFTFGHVSCLVETLSWLVVVSALSGEAMKHSLLALLSAALISALPSTGHAIVASIDVFGIDKNGSNYFTDEFTNGTTPSQESRYFVSGSFPNGAESGGRLTLDSAWGGLAANAAGRRGKHSAHFIYRLSPRRA